MKDFLLLALLPAVRTLIHAMLQNLFVARIHLHVTATSNQSPRSDFTRGEITLMLYWLGLLRSNTVNCIYEHSSHEILKGKTLWENLIINAKCADIIPSSLTQALIWSTNLLNSFPSIHMQSVLFQLLRPHVLDDRQWHYASF
jgi:hypothetical protein